MPWASPSVLDRVIACPASAVLPTGPDVVGPSAAWGKEVHELKETGAGTPRVEKWYTEHYDPMTIETTWPGGDHEVVYLAHEGTVKLLDERPSFMARELYPIGDMFFSLDWQNLYDAPLPWVDDLKTGMMPTSWTQLKAYSWALYQYYPWIQGNLASYTNWTRYPLGGAPVRVMKQYSRDQIETWYQDKVVPAKRLVLGPDAKTMTNPGPHCRWCRCKPYCPEWGGTTGESQ